MKSTNKLYKLINFLGSSILFVYTCFILDDVVNDHTTTDGKDDSLCHKEAKTPTITVAAQTNSANVIKGFDIPQQKQETGN